MGKKRLIIAVALLTAVAGIMAFLLAHSHEPAYQGKTLTAWLDQFGASHWSNNHEQDRQAEAALRHFGTNLTPTYLKMLSTRPSALKMNVLAHVPPIWQKKFHISTTNEYELKVDAVRSRGAYGLIALGPDAKPAVAALIALLNDKVERVRYLSIFTVRCLGPVARDALPSVINCLKDSDSTVRIDAASALGTIHEDPEHVVPILIGLINKTRNGPDLILEYSAICALGDFKNQAEPAVPVLIKSLNDPDADIRQATVLALGSIHARPDLVVPALIANFARAKETSANDLMIVFGSLAEYGPDARSSVPAILRYTNDPDPDIRAGAAIALKNIDPDAAAKLGIK